MKEQIKWLFRLYDINGDGFLNISEILEILKSADLEEGYTTRIVELFQKMDINNDGVLSREEFINQSLNDNTFVSILGRRGRPGGGDGTEEGKEEGEWLERLEWYSSPHVFRSKLVYYWLESDGYFVEVRIDLQSVRILLKVSRCGRYLQKTEDRKSHLDSKHYNPVYQNDFEFSKIMAMVM